MGSQTPIYAIPYPVGTDRVMDGDNAMEAIARAVENLISLPARVTAAGAANTIPAPAWANLPTRLTAALTLARPALVAVTFGAWLSLSAATANGDLRLGVNITGATVEAPPGVGWGEVGYASIAASAPTYVINASVTKFLVMNAGTTTVETQAYKSGTFTAAVNYPTLTVAPIRYTA